MEGEILKGNKIWISFKKTTENNISIKIANTGPQVDTADIRTLNSPEGQVKKSESVAGTKLIRTLLTVFNLGDIFFSQEKLDGNLWQFTAALTLYDWDEQHG